MKVLDLQLRNEYQNCKALQPLSDTAFLDQQSLCFDLVDDLEAAQCNWIGTLDSSWEVDLSSCSLPDAMRLKICSIETYLTLRDLIPLTLQLGYEPVAIEQQRYWVYTICLRVSGLGRVRLVFSFDNSQLTGQCTVLATNRLDWSPRKIIAERLQYSHSAYLLDKSDCQEDISFNFTMPSYSVA